MTPAELIERIVHAHKVEDVFGPDVRDEDQLSAAFQAMAVLLHPDRPGQTAAAAEAMALLTTWRAQARTKLKRGMWGKSAVTIKSKHTYTDVTAFTKGDISDVYIADYTEWDGKKQQAAIKLVRDQADIDLADKEASVLKELWSPTKDGHFWAYLPRLVESTKLTVGGKVRRANVVSFHSTRVTLDEVICAHPQGLDLRHAAWMWRRLLEVLTWTHRQGIVHGAVVPKHMLIHPDNHGLRLIDWSYAVRTEKQEVIKAIPSGHIIDYPPEVLQKRPATPATDIFMAGLVMRDLLSGYGNKLPNSVPRAVIAILDACTLLGPVRRYRDAWMLYEDFAKVLQDLFGPPKFVQFTMPTKGA